MPFIILGSFSILNIIPSLFSFCSFSFSLSSSASITILRNFIILNILPFLPTRFWIKNIGPFDFILIIGPIIIVSTIVITLPIIPNTISIILFTIYWIGLIATRVEVKKVVSTIFSTNNLLPLPANASISGSSICITNPIRSIFWIISFISILLFEINTSSTYIFLKYSATLSFVATTGILHTAVLSKLSSKTIPFISIPFWYFVKLSTSFFAFSYVAIITTILLCLTFKLLKSTLL